MPKDRFEDYLFYLRKKGLKSSTLSKKRSLLKSAFLKLKSGEPLSPYEEKELSSFKKFLDEEKSRNGKLLRESLENLKNNLLSESVLKGKVAEAFFGKERIRGEIKEVNEEFIYIESLNGKDIFVCPRIFTLLKLPSTFFEF